MGDFVGLDVGEDSPTAASSSSHRSDKIIDISSRFGRKFVKFMARYGTGTGTITASPCGNGKERTRSLLFYSIIIDLLH